MTEQNLRILHAISSDRFAGVEQFVRRLAMRQAGDGHRVTVLGGAAAHMQAPLAGVGVAWAPARSTWAVLRELRRRLSESDVVNTHMTAADVAAFAARVISFSDIPIVSTRHFAQRRGTRGPSYLYRLIERRLDAEVSISRAVAERIGVPSTIIHPGVEPGAVADPSRRRHTVLVAQRLQPEKHTDIAIRAYAASAIWRSGWDLQIAGAGPEQSDLAALASLLGLGDRVRFLGFRTDLSSLMSEEGLLFASSPFEHFGLTVLEAMSAGLPVVAAAAGGHEEMLSGLDRRALFPADDIDGAAARLRALAGDADARDALGSAEQARQAAQFTLRGQADATEAVYRKAISRRANDHRRASRD